MISGTDSVAEALRTGARIAPSQLGGYAHRAKEMPIGPAGVHIPDARAAYRTTVDGELLLRIAKKAYGDWAAVQLPMSWWQHTADVLTGDLAKRFPPKDMAVLSKYGLTGEVGFLVVHIRGGCTHKPVRLEMFEPRPLPQRAAHFLADLAEDMPGTDPRVPAETMDFFRMWDAVARAEREDFTNVVNAPGRFKVKHGRWPRWEEIEADWPMIRDWLAGQRSALAQ